MPNDSKADAVKKARRDKKRDDGNRSRVVVEGVDEPKREGRYSDRIKVDPFTRPYFYRHEIASYPGPLKKA